MIDSFFDYATPIFEWVQDEKYIREYA